MERMEGLGRKVEILRWEMGDGRWAEWLKGWKRSGDFSFSRER